MIAGLIAVAKTVGTAAAGSGASFGVQTLLGKLFGSQTDKKAANFANDVNANTIQGNNIFNSIKTSTNIAGNGYSFQYQSGEDAVKIYRSLLSDEEIEGLRNNIMPSVQQDPYFGGLGNSYTSPIGKTVFNTVPAVGIMQTIDNYLNARDRQTSTAAANNSSGLINYDDLFTQIKKDLGIAPAVADQKKDLGIAPAVAAQESLATPNAGNYTNYLLIGGVILGAILLIRRR